MSGVLSCIQCSSSLDFIKSLNLISALIRCFNTGNVIYCRPNRLNIDRYTLSDFIHLSFISPVSACHFVLKITALIHNT